MSYVKHALFFWRGVLRRPRLFLALSAAVGSWLYYDACLDPDRAPWWCSEHPTSLSWLFLSRRCVPLR